ncbi:MAG: hypothetical protein JXA87_09735 [Thermoleophilia bacterium]|nr:hypothetical protein [Thermoleophilia bacterium]
MSGMNFVRLILAAFIGGLLAIVVAIAWKSSKETGKSLQASFVDVPTEAQRLAQDARAKVTEAASTGWQTVKEKEAELAKRIPHRGGEEADMVAEAVVDEAAETV